MSVRRNRSSTARLLCRIRARRARRGAAVLVVTLVVTMLTALGLFAVRSSSLATATSGHNRMLTQVHYIADYAVVAAAEGTRFRKGVG